MFGCRANARRCSLPFDALFVPQALRAAVSDEAWFGAMVAAERALRAAEERVGVVSPADAPHTVELGGLAEAGRAAGNPVEPLVRRLRERDEYAHWGATSQDVLDTAAALVARDAMRLILDELDGVAEVCARLADEHRATVMAARTLMQQAVPTTFGLKAANWLVGIVHARGRLADAQLPAQLGGAAGMLAALGDKGIEVLAEYAGELDL